MLRPVMLTFQGMKSELRLRPGMLFKTVWLKATGDSAPNEHSAHGVAYTCCSSRHSYSALRASAARVST